ncbi:uncharacterized protein MYU51_003465 [Penicillium brevicompactum]
MRLRSNHVLEPVAEWEQTRRRHVRASSAQSESESEPQPEPQPARRRRGARSVSTQPETQQESQPATRRRNTRGSSAQPEAQPEPQQPASRRRTTRGSSAQPEARQDLQPARRRNTRGASAQPEPQREPQPATRRRNTRGSSAQPEPQPEPQPATRRRRNTRGSSAQPESQSEPNEQVLSTPARQARRGRAANKDKSDLVTNLLELVSSSPALSPLVSHSGSPIAVSLTVVSTPVAFLSPIPEVSSAPATPATPSPAGGIFDTPTVSVMEEEDVFFTPLAPTPQNVVLSSFVSTPEDVFYTPVGPTPTSTSFVPSGPLGPPGPRFQKPQNRMYTDLWLPRIEPTETTLAVMTSEDPEMRRRSTRPTRRRHRLPPLYYGSAATLLVRKPNSNPLTRTQDGNRKRTRTTEDETPAKRYKPAPVITPGGSLIRARGSSRTTYADRTRRRQAEIGGRIHSTMFRVPEYLAQRDADARSASLPQDNDTHEQTPTPEESALPRETPVPATPIRANTPGWGRWVFDSVSRRWTGILGRPNVPQAADASHPAEREQQHTQAETSQQHGHSSLTAVSSSVPAGTSTTSPVRGSPAPVASARTDSHQAPTVPPRRRYNNYDLFSAGYSEEQRARWLINVPPAPTAPATTAIDSSTTQSAPQSSRAAQPETPTASKRKRQPTPDKIPNPPGCSYGLHDDYFIYDDEDWEANEKYNEQHPKITPTRAGASEDPDTEKRSSKRVRIKSPANSNQATSPRKMGSRRSRAERPANFNWSGHFEVPYSSSESSSSTRTSPASQSQTPGPFPSSPGPFPSSPAATPRVNASRRERVERPGPSEAPYSSPENSGSIASSPLDLPAPNTRSYHTTVESVEDDHSSFRDESPKTIGGAEPPKAEKDLGPLQKARDQAEQYKPKTPSRLRAAHRFSSSNTSYATSRSPFVRELEYVSTEAVRRRMMRETSLAKACPSGDMNQIRWPENDTWENRLRGGLTREVVAYNRRTQRHNLLSPAKLEEFDQRYHEALSRRRLENNYKPSLWSQRQLVK